MQKLVFTNGDGQTIDLTSGNFGITNWEGLSGVGLNIQTQQVPFQDGGVFLDALMEQREISITVAIQDNNDLSARYERKRQLISALNPKLGEGVLVYTNDYLSRQIKAVPQLPIFENKNSNDAGTLKASVVFSCPSPYWEDLEETVVSFGFNDRPTIINEGDVKTQLKIEWETNSITNGALTNKTQGQKIKYNGLLTNNLKINTNIGEKSVTSESIKFEELTVGSQFRIAYAKDIETIIIFSSSAGFISTDGQNWESVEIGSNTTSVVYANNLHIFVATSSSGLKWSEDGRVWNTGSGDYIVTNSVTYSEDKQLFVAVGTGNISISEDGKQWSSVTSGVSNILNQICYSQIDGLFVAVGGLFINTVTIITSSDGVNWTFQQTGINCQSRSICHSYLLGLFVAPEYITVGANSKCLYSPDGINWDYVTIPIIGVQNICYSEVEKKFIAVGSGGNIAISSDGINWTVTQIENETENLYSVQYCYNIKQFLVSDSIGSMLGSSNGDSWDYLKTGLGGEYSSLYYVKEWGLYFLAGNPTTATKLKILKSTDFNHWEIAYISDRTGILQRRSINYFKEINKLIVCCDSYCYSSSDGINWEEETFQATKIIYVEETQKYYKIYNNNISTSIDCENWDSGVNLEHISSLRDICYSKNKNIIIAVGTTAGYSAYSTDGINWNESTMGLGDIGTSPAIAYSEELGIFVIASSYIYTSFDGINWAKRTSSHGLCVIYCKEKKQFIVSGEQISSDGINWTTLEEGKRLSDIIFSEQDDCYYGVRQKVTLGSYEIPIENSIDKLSADSDIGMNLKVGENQFVATSDIGEMHITLKYRQKYIGV